MKQNFYEFLESKEREILPDSRLDPLVTKDFQLKLIDWLIRCRLKDVKVKAYKHVILSGKRKLNKDERNILKKIFIDFFYNKDPSTFSNPPPSVYLTSSYKPTHYLAVEIQDQN